MLGAWCRMGCKSLVSTGWRGWWWWWWCWRNCVLNVWRVTLETHKSHLVSGLYSTKPLSDSESIDWSFWKHDCRDVSLYSILLNYISIISGTQGLTTTGDTAIMSSLIFLEIWKVNDKMRCLPLHVCWGFRAESSAGSTCRLYCSPREELCCCK